MKEKIKEKIPGVGGMGGDRRQQEDAMGMGAGGYGEEYQAGGQQQEKKGIMEKIKEKLPGSH